MPEPCSITRGYRGQSNTVRAIAAQQEGIVSRAQLLGGGVSGWALDRALRSGTLHRLAWRWQIVPAPPNAVEVAAPHRRRLQQGDVVWNGRFRSTSVPRTLLDLAARYTQRALLRALAEAEFQHDLRPDDILRTLRRGHPGSANLRAALNAHAPGYGQAKSRLERRFRALLIRHGIELPERSRFVPRRYGTKQLDDRSAKVIADVLGAFDDAARLGYTNQQ